MLGLILIIKIPLHVGFFNSRSEWAWTTLTSNITRTRHSPEEAAKPSKKDHPGINILRGQTPLKYKFSCQCTSILAGFKIHFYKPKLNSRLSHNCRYHTNVQSCFSGTAVLQKLEMDLIQCNVIMCQQARNTGSKVDMSLICLLPRQFWCSTFNWKE